jgi:hypothetical protein
MYGQDVGHPFSRSEADIDLVAEDLRTSLYGAVLDVADLVLQTKPSQPTRRWFIQKVVPDGKVGDETDSGTWIETYQVQVPYTIDGKQYFYGQDLGAKK